MSLSNKTLETLTKEEKKDLARNLMWAIDGVYHGFCSRTQRHKLLVEIHQLFLNSGIPLSSQDIDIAYAELNITKRKTGVGPNEG